MKYSASPKDLYNLLKKYKLMSALSTQRLQIKTVVANLMKQATLKKVP